MHIHAKQHGKKELVFRLGAKASAGYAYATGFAAKHCELGAPSRIAMACRCPFPTEKSSRSRSPWPLGDDHQSRISPIVRCDLVAKLAPSQAPDGSEDQ
jgi:hypothetical protein